MNIKARNDRVILVTSLCAVGAILIIFVGIPWWQSQNEVQIMKTEELSMQGYTWGAPTITLTVKNTGSTDLPVTEVRVNGTVVNTVAYGENFKGTTTHTLERFGTVGTITIAYPFESGVNYEIDVVSAIGNEWTYVVTAP